MKNLFITTPHSGEKIAVETDWLNSLSEEHLMRDTDRFVDQLYLPVIQKNKIKHLNSEWHRYVVDLNRDAEDIDQYSVNGSKNDLGRFSKKGVHWQMTTFEEPLLQEPMSRDLHDLLIKKYYQPFHRDVQKQHDKFVNDFGKSYQIDCHSMPSVGTKMHSDNGQERAEIVISDFNGLSCETEFKDLVIEAYEKSGFQVAYNFPYIGGRITEKYGKPDQMQNCIQVEIRRNLYMNEHTKKIYDDISSFQNQLSIAIEYIIKKGA